MLKQPWACCLVALSLKKCTNSHVLFSIPAWDNYVLNWKGNNVGPFLILYLFYILYYLISFLAKVSWVERISQFWAGESRDKMWTKGWYDVFHINDNSSLLSHFSSVKVNIVRTSWTWAVGWSDIGKFVQRSKLQKVAGVSHSVSANLCNPRFLI